MHRELYKEASMLLGMPHSQLCEDIEQLVDTVNERANPKDYEKISRELMRLVRRENMKRKCLKALGILFFPLMVVMFWFAGFVSGKNISILRSIKASCQTIKGTFDGLDPRD